MSSSLVPVQVGALACQRDSFLKKLTTKIFSIKKVDSIPLPSGIIASAAAAASGKKNNNTSTSTSTTATATSEPKKSYYEVVLLDSCLFPEGGGQLSDKGFLKSLNNDKQELVNVVQVQRQQDTAVHYCEMDSNNNDDLDQTPPFPFKEQDEVECVVDWDRRYDCMQHHSCQHLLTAVTEELLKIPTDSWSLSYPTCHILLPTKSISAEDVEKVEKRCNELIQQNVKINVLTFPSREEVPASRSRGIPADVNGPIRLVEIPEVDTCTCCGTHVQNLSQLSMVKLLHQEAKGPTVRLHFICGERVRKYFSEMYTRERKLMKDLGLAPQEIVEGCERRGKIVTAATKTEKKLRAEVATLQAPSIVAAASSSSSSQEASSSSSASPQNSVFLFHREDADNEMLTVFVDALSKSGVAASKICCLAGGALNKTSEGSYMIVGPEEQVVKDFAEQVFMPAFNGNAKGNFVRGVFRGKITAGSMTCWKDFVKKTKK